MFLHDKGLSLLEKSLDAAVLRHQVLAHNLANINTPRFKRSSVSFETELKRAMDEKPVPLAVTHGRHMGPPPPGEAEPRIVQDQTTTMRLDGNNVDLEREMLDLLTNQIWYSALTQRVSGRLETWRYIITEGRR